MADACQTRRRGSPRCVAALCAVLALLVAPAAARAQRILQESLVRPDDTRPITLRADAIATWADGSRRAFLLKGRASIVQGNTALRMPQGVVWVDESRRAATGTYLVDVYGEGGIELEEQAGVRADYGTVRLATRGEVKIYTYAGKVVQADLSADPVYRRARANPPPAPAVAKSAPLAPAVAKSAPPPQTPPAWTPTNGGGVQQAVAVAPAAGARSVIVPAGGTAAQDGGTAPPPLGPPSPVEGSGTGSEPPTTESKPRVPPPPPISSFPPYAPELPARAPSTSKLGQPPGSEGEPPVAPGAEGLPGELPAPRVVPVGPPPVPGPERLLSIRPRSSRKLDFEVVPQPNGETAFIVTNGVIISVRVPPPTNAPAKKGGPSSEPRGEQLIEERGVLDIEADRLVFWTKGTGQELLKGMQSPGGQSSRSMEFYLSGNVEIRSQSGRETQRLSADEVYYDVGRNVAVALRGRLEVREPRLPYPIHFDAEEILQLNAKTYKATRGVVYATILPSDPGLKVEVRDATVEEQTVQPKTIFGTPRIDRKTGKPKQVTEHIFRGKSLVTRLEGVPVFYFPYLRGRVEDPFGPLEALSFNYNNIFGFQAYTTWDIYDLLGLDPIPGHRWRLYADYLSLRGPALGTEYDLAQPDFFGLPARTEGLVKAYGLKDQGKDVLGGGRGEFLYTNPPPMFTPITHPDWRGRLLGKLNVQDLPAGFSGQAQLGLISDINFLEQYFFRDYFNELNQDTSLYVKQQQGTAAWTLMGQVRLLDWYTTTEWLPRGNGYLLGQTFFDRFVYDLKADVGYARLRTPNQGAPAYQPTIVPAQGMRGDLWQDISYPMQLGAFKVVPYLNGDLTYYGQDVQGDRIGRAYGGAGVRASLPLSRLYPGVDSELFNLNGIYHKMLLTGNYYYARSNVSVLDLPQYDLLYDNTTDLSMRELRPFQPVLNPANANFLLNDPLVNPQLFALRRLLFTDAETRGDIDVFQIGLRQRLQTKRGFPGQQHVIDWMLFDVRASLFPQSVRDNFGRNVGILEYDWLWNVGDSTGLYSDGWMEPIAGGPRYFNMGLFTGRPNLTNLTVGFRLIDPLQSRSVYASMSFPFSAKYAATAGTVWDFGTKTQSYTVGFTRTGTDLQLSLGFSVNSILNTVGVQFMVVPTLLRGAGRVGSPGMPLSSQYMSANQSTH